MSVALTMKVWLPAARVVYVLGLVHVEYPLSSIWHWNVDPASGAVKEKVALVWFVGFVGWLVMDVSGTVVSITQE